MLPMLTNSSPWVPNITAKTPSLHKIRRIFSIPSGYVKIAIENGPVEIVDFPSYKMVDLSSSLCKITRPGTFPISPGPSEGPSPHAMALGLPALYVSGLTVSGGFLSEARPDVSLMGLAWLSNPPGWKSKIMCKIM